MAGFFDPFLESIQSLPNTLRRNLNLITDLECKAHDLVKLADQLSDEYMKEVKNLSTEEKTERYQKIMSLYTKAESYANEKMTLAQQTYNVVDKQINQIDDEIKKAVPDKQDDNPPISTTKKEGKRGRKSLKVEEPDESIILKTELCLNMDIDPNEPLYCLCQQVSYGEMVGCDEKDCPYEWFHFQCVSLTSKPKGKWYCPECTAKKKSK